MHRPSDHVACAILAIILGILSSGSAPSAQAQSSMLSGFSFLRLDASARTASLGSAQTALWDEDVNSFFTNPALLNERTHRALSLTYLHHLSDIQAGFAAYAHEIDQLGHVGAGLRFISFGSFDRYDEHGFADGTFGAGDVVLTTGIARPLSEQVHLGANVHLGYSRLDETSATVLMADVGVAYQIPSQQLVLSMAVNNVGFALDRYYEAPLDLPADVRLGVAKRLQHLPVTIVLDAYELHNVGGYATDQSAFEAALQHMALGLEINITSALDARAGYSHRHQEALRQNGRFDAAGISAGFGLEISALQLDYGYRSWSHETGGLHQFTLRTHL